MIDYILGYWANPWIALFLYWLPLGICAVGYTLRTFENYHKDLKARSEYVTARAAAKAVEGTDNGRAMMAVGYYRPTDKIGTLIGRAVVSICPIANVWSAMFDVSPRLFHRLIQQIERFFDQPLVPSPDRD
jgi:hypothetical protein